MTRKQREMEQRASEILRVARPILVSEGYQALSMDRVAAQMEYAKGTIYNHFPNKEEIVVALAVQSMELRRKLFEQASSIHGQPRIRMMGLGVACEFFTQHCTEDFVLEQWVRNQGIWEKSTEKSQNAVRQGEGLCMAIVAGIVRDGISAGDLQIPETISPEEFVFGFWALNYGSQILTHTSPSLPALGINKPLNAIRVHCSTLLNGFGWSPLMDAVTYSSEMAVLEEKLLPKFWELKKSS